MKIFIKYLLCLAGITLLAPPLLQAQGSFIPGYIKDNAGKTIYCELLNTGREESSMDYIYKIPPEDSIIHITPYNIMEFGLDNRKKFVRAKAIVENSPDRIYQISDTARGLQWEERFIFLEVLIEGPSATLYYFFDDGKDRFYFKTDTTAIIPLIYKKYTVAPTPNIPEKFIINNTFRNQLAYYLSCDNIKQKISTLEYSKKALTALFSNYLTCKGEPFRNYAVIQKGKFHLRGIFLSDLSTLKVQDGTTAHYQYPSELNFGFGLEAEYAFAYNRHKWAIFLEANYHHFSATNAQYSLGTPVPETRVEYRSVNTPVGVAYSFILNKYSRFFIKAGVAAEFVLKDSYISFDVDNPENNYSLTPTTGLLLGTGYRYRFISLEARISSKKNITRNIYLHESNLRIYSFRIAFSFF